MPNDLVHRTSTLKFINFLCIGYLQDRQCQQKVQELQKLLEVAESCHKQEIKVLRENYEKKMGESNLRFQSITHAVKVSLAVIPHHHQSNFENLHKVPGIHWEIELKMG